MMIFNFRFEDRSRDKDIPGQSVPRPRDENRGLRAMFGHKLLKGKNGCSQRSWYFICV